MILQFLFLAATVGYGLALPVDQIPLVANPAGTNAKPHLRESAEGRRLKGKFLHVTDFHPDGFYKPYTSTAEDCACHRDQGPAGLFGAETSDCDSPTTLVNATFQWIDQNLKNEIDFIIWTGDSARHDADEKIPRTEKEVLELNTMLVDKFTEVFGKQDNIDEMASPSDMTIPIIPTFGNNDVQAHNIMSPGPNTWTRQFSHVWKKFIPQEQVHTFEKGGWFFVEAIPNQLAIFSLNTLYFFDSNTAVNGCAKKSEPGHEQMEWLRIKLHFLRQRGMKAIITGHVPPARTESKQSWDETCWQKYALWLQQYRDVVVGSIYGHMNIDHFMLQDFKDINKKTRKGRNVHIEKQVRIALDDDTLTAQTKSEYLSELRNDWSHIPGPPNSNRKSQHCEGFFCDLVDYVNELRVEWAKLPKPPITNSGSASYMGRFYDAMQSMRKRIRKQNKSKEEKYLERIGGPWGESYALSLVSPSIVPNYFPTMRVVEYNITGVDTKSLFTKNPGSPISGHQRRSDGFLVDGRMISKDEIDDMTEHDCEKSRESLSQKKHYEKKPKFTVPSPPSKGTPPGPAYSPQTFSLLGYTQYFANLTKINNDFTQNPAQEDDVKAQKKWREGKHSGKQPKPDKPKKHHATFKYEVEYDTRNDTIWGLQDLTMKAYLDLARRIGHYQPPQDDYSEMQFDDDEDEEEEEPPFCTGVEDEKDNLLEMIGHKKKKHHSKKGKINKVWFTFVRRAFVGAVDDEALKEEFGMAQK